MRKTILITGASSGLGAGMAREFARLGRDLALCARRLPLLEALRDELVSTYPKLRIAIRAIDVTNHDEVFSVFQDFREKLGSLDRIIVNAGTGKGRALGTGHFRANKQTAETNFVAALAQCEAALEIFRAQNAGHLVTISSMSAMRGLPRNLTTYAATKAGLAALAEGIRADLIGTPIKVSTIYPGFIRTGISDGLKKTPFMIDLEEGCRALVKAIEREKPEACVPAWPWTPLGFLLRRIPLRLVARIT